MDSFNKETLSSSDAFWVMFYFLKEQYDLRGDNLEVGLILSDIEPIGYDQNGHFDFEGKNVSFVTPAEEELVINWNEAIEKFKREGRPPLKRLTK